MSKEKYVISKEACEADINDKVCPRCGRKIQALETVNNGGNPTFWRGCTHGSDSGGHFSIGVNIETFNLAKKAVLDDVLISSFNIKISNEADFEYYYQEQTQKICSIIERLEGYKCKSFKPRFTKEELYESWLSRNGGK